MDVIELRTAFTLSSQFIEVTKDFRSKRIAAINVNNTATIPILIEQGVKVIIHTIPLYYNDYNSKVDLSVLNIRSLPRWALNLDLGYGRFNLDGFVRPFGLDKNNTHILAYTQIFRNGAVESVRTFRVINSKFSLFTIETTTLEQLKEALIIQQNLGVQLPIVIMLSLANVLNIVLLTGDSFQDRNNPFIPIGQQNILIPDMLLENYMQDLRSMMKPMFDILWNVAGLETSLSYRGNEWIRK